jgi:hypothetical protein
MCHILRVCQLFTSRQIPISEPGKLGTSHPYEAPILAVYYGDFLTPRFQLLMITGHEVVNALHYNKDSPGP